MIEAGRILVRGAAEDGRFTRIDVDPQRPAGLRRALLGRRAVEIPALVELLYPVCGMAHRAAAATALTALGLPAIAPSGEALLTEQARAIAWRLLLDWPALLGEKPDHRTLLAIRGATGADLAARLEGLVPDIAEVVTLARLEAFAARGGCLAARVIAAALMLGDQDAPIVTMSVLAPAIMADPRPFGGMRPVPEIGPMASQRHPLIRAARDTGMAGTALRLFALAMEAQFVARRLRAGDAPRPHAALFGEGMAVGIVETARGPLVHRLSVVGGHIRDHVVIAPTDWHFAPSGPFARALRYADPSKDPRAVAALVAAGFDACVPVMIEFDAQRAEAGHA